MLASMASILRAMPAGEAISSLALLRSRRRLHIGLLSWAGTSTIGVAVVALPDRGPRLFSLSEGHCPSLMGAVGIGVLLVEYTAFVAGLWAVRSVLPARRSGGVLVVAGAVVVGWSVVTGSGLWWLAGVALLVGVQVAAAAVALRRLRGVTS